MQRLTIKFLSAKIKLRAAFSKKKAAQEAFKLFCTPRKVVLAERPLIYDLAKPVRFMLNGLKVRGYRWNHPKDNKVLIIHGFSSAPYKYDKYIISLINKGYEVMSFDAPAHGRSHGKTVNIVEYRDMLVKAIEKYGPFNKYIAHSMGGIALVLALETIEHNSDSKIVLIAPATETTSTLMHACETLELDYNSFKDEFDEIIQNISGKPTEWFSINRAIHNIKANILWIHDEHDEITPIEDALKIKEKGLQNIQFHITKHLGHQKIYHDENVKEIIINFI